MTEQDVRPLLEMTPFEPFTVSLTGRSTFDVDRPELVSFSPDGALMNLHAPDGSVRVMIATHHVVSITWPAQPVIRES